MKIVVVTESAATGGQLAVLVPENDLYAFQVLVARAGSQVKAITDEKQVWNKDFTLRREDIHAVSV
jgi:hypothetical protein